MDLVEETAHKLEHKAVEDNSPENVALASIAISLKRIADMIQYKFGPFPS